MLTFAEFTDHLERARLEIRPAIEIGLAGVGELAQTMAVEYIGREMPEWAPLSKATLEGFTLKSGRYIPGKIELGYVGHVSSTDPLLRTGALRDSIGMYVQGYEAVIGSPLDTALWQELGTVRPDGPIPPRPFLALAMSRVDEHVGDIFGEIAVRILTPTIAGSLR
jgi:phage gpG-like protein